MAFQDLCYFWLTLFPQLLHGQLHTQLQPVHGQGYLVDLIGGSCV